jgi:hypothetical protein
MYIREIEIQAMMAEGFTMSQICDSLAPRYKVSPRTIENQYYALVNAMRKLVEEGRAELRAKLMAQNDLIYKKSLTEKKYKVALDATTAQAKLAGLYEPGQQETAPPDVIEVEQRDFSTRPVLVGERAENE